MFLGPVIREDNKKRTLSYIEKGLEEGARLVCDGRENVSDDGYFVGPTIFDNVTTEMTIWKDEIFAPVLSVIRVKNLKEAIEIANKSEFANGACLFTSNSNAIRYFRENIDAGMLGINLVCRLQWRSSHSQAGNLHSLERCMRTEKTASTSIHVKSGDGKISGT